jgi:hypothetical protein
MVGFVIFMLFLLLFFGAIIAGVVFLIRASTRAGKKHFDDASTALLPLIAGTAANDQLHGTYQGMPVTASIVVQSQQTAGDAERTNVYYFFTSLSAGPGQSDWKLAFGGEGLLGTGHKTWHVESHDADLAARLTDAGAATAAARSSVQSGISYRAQDGMLSSRLPGSYRKTWADAATFANQLEVLAALADCNRRANNVAQAAT